MIRAKKLNAISQNYVYMKPFFPNKIKNKNLQRRIKIDKIFEGNL